MKHEIKFIIIFFCAQNKYIFSQAQLARVLCLFITISRNFPQQLLLTGKVPHVYILESHQKVIPRPSQYIISRSYRSLLVVLQYTILDGRISYRIFTAYIAFKASHLTMFITQLTQCHTNDD